MREKKCDRVLIVGKLPNGVMGRLSDGYEYVEELPTRSVDLEALLVPWKPIGRELIAYGGQPQQIAFETSEVRSKSLANFRECANKFYAEMLHQFLGPTGTANEK